MKFFKVSFILFLFSFSSFAQTQVARYYFDKNLQEFSGSFIPLEIVGTAGGFRKEVVERFGKTERWVYAFKENAGFLFDNTKVKNFVKQSYTIEMYFKYDRGDLLLYNQLLGDRVGLLQGKYIHLVTSRDYATKKVLVYLNGIKKVEFIDSDNQSEVGEDGVFNFFSNDDNPTTSGAVAMIKIYDHFIDNEASKELFENFREDFVAEQLKVSDKNPIRIKNLYFVQSLAKLLPESATSIDLIHDYLLENKEAKIELQGHTDNVGDFDVNVKLSKDRAEAIKTALVARGVASSRVQTRGFGSMKPVASNAKEETRKLNRRVEMAVLTP
jgi:OmpA-OmpF porin, OOP family